MANSEALGRRFIFEWRLALLTAVLLPLMMYLGLWQLNRADEKRALQAAVKAMRAKPSVMLDGLDVSDPKALNYHPVTLIGEWLSHGFLLDNQLQRGRVGYHVISALRLVNGRTVLVNRGWVLAPKRRQELPVVPDPVVGAVEYGEVYVGENFLKDENIYADYGWPRRVEYLYMPALSRELDMEIMPITVRLKANSPSALTVNWSVVNMSPAKHTAYAVQWFCLAVALMIFFCALSFRRVKTAAMVDMSVNVDQNKRQKEAV